MTENHHGSAQHQHHHDPVHLDEADWQAWAEDTEIQGEVLLRFVTDTAARASALRNAEAAAVRRVLDVGSGPGVGSCELARIFPDAEVIALDSSPAMLERASRRAANMGAQTRVSTRLAELPDGIDGLGLVDFIWASMSLHHVGDEVAALRTLRALLGPDGLIAIAEIAEPTRVLPDDLGIGRPGLSDRLGQIEADWFARMREGLANSVDSSDLPTMLRAAGLDVLDSRVVHEHIEAPLPDSGRRMVLGHLRRMHKHFAEQLDAEDLRTLEVLIDPDDARSVMHRSDTFVAASRHILIAAANGDDHVG